MKATVQSNGEHFTGRLVERFGTDGGTVIGFDTEAQRHIRVSGSIVAIHAQKENA